jgi:hypothetical protein
MSAPVLKGSLTDAPGYLPDALQLSALTPFVPENVVLDEYTFFPWVRTGLASAVEPPAEGTVRGVVHVSVSVQDDAGLRVDVPPAMLTLRGPGDVIGLDSGQIIRRFPMPGTRDAEENLLAHIEFDRPELPWLFSPLAAPNDRLPPWLALVVCDAAVSSILLGPPGFPPQLHTLRGELQPLEDSWAWAHAQIMGKTGDPQSQVDRLSVNHGPANLSRLLCPRKLTPLRSYLACLVPAFDCGVKAASGLGGGMLAPAWSRAPNDAGNEIALPVFDSWSFSVAPAGDFELLAGRLQGLPAPWNVGRRFVDTTHPRGGLPKLPADAPGAVQILRCALVSPTPLPPDLPPENSAWDAPAREKLRHEVDRVNANQEENLPRVGPRLYARFQRGQAGLGPVFGQPPNDTTAADADWFSQLNTSPVHRIVAGLGTRVVQRDQEKLMEAAWAQVGEIRKVNEALVRLQFGRFVGEALHRNHLARLELGPLAQVLRGVQDKVRPTGATLTLYGTVNRSAVAPAAVSGAFRRATRVRGPLARLADSAGAIALRQLVAANGTFRDFRRLYIEPEGVLTLSSSAIAAIPPALLAEKLGVDEASAPRVLEERIAARTSDLSVADHLARPFIAWPVREGTLDLGTRAALQIAQRVHDTLPSRVVASPGRAEALTPLLVGLGNTSVPQVAARSKATTNRIGRSLPFSPIPSRVGFPLGLGLPQPARAFSAAASTTTATARLASRLRFETEVSRTVTAAVTTSHALENRAVAMAVSQVVTGIGVAGLTTTPDRPQLDFTRAQLLTTVAPARTVTAYAYARLRNPPSWLAPDWFKDGRITPIMAAPRFDRAMFAALHDYDRDWLIPGMDKIELTDFVTTLETNPEFTETFLIGLSDEMGRELLWRGYPTDQRGTYFYRFWNEDRDELAKPIHRFDPTPLQTHLIGSGGTRVVLVARGEVIRRYPDLLFHALRTSHTGKGGEPVFADPKSDPASVAPILFHHHLAPDILLVGFDLSPDEIRRTTPYRWWFVLAQNPSAPAFGLDLTTEGNPAATDGVKRNDLDWNDLGALTDGRFLSASARTLSIKDDQSTPQLTTWPGNAAIVARTLLQNPARAAFDAPKLIAPALPT